jgi:hypothetical protein
MLEGDHANQVWEFSTDAATKLGVSNPENGAGCYYRADAGETVLAAIRRQEPGWFEGGREPFFKAALRPGEFYPRIARPIHSQIHMANLGWGPNAQHSTDFIAVARGQLVALGRQLDRICQTVHPTEETLDTYGHDIRNLLILASTEVENHWRGVLVSNGVTRDKFSTTEYIRLKDPLRLSEYSVSFTNYPWLPPFSPYKTWSNLGSTTSSIEWYSAYNAVKHNREKEFREAKLRHAFDALSACTIMMAAQFGYEGFGKNSELLSLMQFTHKPTWAASEAYLWTGNRTVDPNLSVNFPFGL